MKRQIDAAREKEPPYEDKEIVEAVIRSVTAGTQLRTFLESSSNLTLDRLIDTLKSYFLEADGKDLLQQLATLRQETGEDAQIFLMRGLELKHRILLERSTGKKSLSCVVVQDMLLQSLETGFAGESMRSRMRPHLQDTSISEEMLMKEVSLAMKSERDRKSKFDKRSAARINKVETATNVSAGKGESQSDGNVTQSLLDEERSLRAELAELKIQVNSNSQVKEVGYNNFKAIGGGPAQKNCFCLLSNM